ncbi:SEC-C domain-containing protein [Robertmurraya massiliosenegalensis]|uniref:YecA family protein n=1 Tax=Robertmurraya TaxID=2837507 RepID=UPI0039A6EFB3
MNIKVSRNEPCPCGSGKKYKKCCGMQKTVSITSIIEKEVVDLQVQLIQYATREYEFEIEQDFEAKVEELLIEGEEEMEYYLFIHTVWFALFEHVDNGGTILQRFIEEKSRMIQRPKVKEILQSWTNPRPIAGRLLSIDASNMTVLDTLTEETLAIKLLEPIDSEENSFVFGFLVPFGNEWALFPTAFDLEGEEDDKDEQFIKDRFEVSDYEDPIEFLEEEMIFIMNELPYASIEYGASDFIWSDESHKAIAQLYENEMKKLDAPPMAIAGGIILWYRYCEKVSQLTKKPATYAAAIQYINMTINPLIKVTKKEVALQYGISPSTLSVAVTEMEAVVKEEIIDMRSMYLEEIVEAFEDEDMPF